MAEELARHTMVKASAAGWAAVMSRHPELASEPIIDDWARAGRPLIVRRPAPQRCRRHDPLGLPLPPNHGKQRIALALAPRRHHRIGPAASPWPMRPLRRLRAWHETIGLLHPASAGDPHFWQPSLAAPPRPALSFRQFGPRSALAAVAGKATPAPASSDIGRIAKHGRRMRLDGEIVGRAEGSMARGSSELTTMKSS